MEPGRELDILVAEKVMGYTKRLVPKGSLPNMDVPSMTFPREDGWLFTNSGGYDDYFMGHVNDMFVSRSRGQPETLEVVPPYSTSIEAAWQVVEKIQGGAISVIKRCDELWACSVDLEKLERWTSFGKTAPHAICLAALEAVKKRAPLSEDPRTSD